MNIYEKLQQMRVDLQNMKLKKSGENKFAGYKYYELGDILPPINQLMNANKVAAVVSFGEQFASLTLVNAENPDETVEFTSPMATASLKGAHDIQNLGAVETYQRRYLYMTAFEVVESDYFDATQGRDQNQNQSRKKGKVKNMSEDMSNRLNEAVSAYSELSGERIKDIVAEISKELDRNPATMSDADGENALALLNAWSDEAIEKLGV